MEKENGRFRFGDQLFAPGAVALLEARRHPARGRWNRWTPRSKQAKRKRRWRWCAGWGGWCPDKPAAALLKKIENQINPPPPTPRPSPQL